MDDEGKTIVPGNDWRLEVGATNLAFQIGMAVDKAITNSAWPAAITRAEKDGKAVMMSVADVEAAAKSLGLDWAIEPAKESLTRTREGWKARRDAERSAATSASSGQGGPRR